MPDVSPALSSMGTELRGAKSEGVKWLKPRRRHQLRRYASVGKVRDLLAE